MLIVGAKGLAKELLQIIQESGQNQSLYFYDDVSLDSPKVLHSRYEVFSNTEQVRSLFNIDPRFILGLGQPHLRKQLSLKFEYLGGQLTSTISKEAYISREDVSLGEGVSLMAGIKISNGVKIGKALLAYYDVIITHDVKIGDYVELSPGCKLLGRVSVKDKVHVGTGAIILPNITLGARAVIGAGAVVTKDVRPDTVVIGNPAKEYIKK